MITVPLHGTNVSIPILGFGTWQIPKDNVANLVKNAIDVGYTHIDCAYIYANEYELGSQLFSKLKNRQDYFITTKLWGNFAEPHRVEKGFQESLNNLHLQYTDLYLIHNPCRFCPDNNDNEISQYFKKEWIIETWREMEKLYEKDLTKSIGVSNFSTKKLEYLIDECSIIPHVNQVELHPFLPQHKLLEFCNENKICAVGYSPLGTPGTINLSIGKHNAPVLLKDPVITEIAKKYHTTNAKVLLSWGINYRKTPLLVKSSSESRMKENFDSQNLILSLSDYELIDKIDTRVRYLDFNCYVTPGGSIDDFWDNETFG